MSPSDPRAGLNLFVGLALVIDYPCLSLTARSSTIAVIRYNESRLQEMVFPDRSFNRKRRRRAAAAVELALLLPLLLFVLIVAIDFCRLFFHYTTITNAARNGALWASDPFANGTVTPSQSPYPNLFSAASADANNLNPALTSSNVTSSTGTDGQGNATVSVTVQYQFDMVTTYLGFGSVNLSRQVTMRVAPIAP